jgi:hypothetical protein
MLGFKFNAFFVRLTLMVRPSTFPSPFDKLRMTDSGRRFGMTGSPQVLDFGLLTT